MSLINFNKCLNTSRSVLESRSSNCQNLNSCKGDNLLFSPIDDNDSDPFVMISGSAFTGNVQESFVEVNNQENNSSSKNNNSSNEGINCYEDSITIESGEKTPYYVESDGKIYYYKNRLDLTMSKFLEDPTSTAVGIGNVEQTWGDVTDFYLVVDDSRFYFSTPYDRDKAKWLNSEEIKNLSIGREPMQLKGGSDVKSGVDAVILDSGEQTEYYMDVDNIRYYYSSLAELSSASKSNNPGANACGRGCVMTEWGQRTEYSLEYNGATYYFENEADMLLAQKDLASDSASIFKMLKLDKLVVGRS